MDAKEEKIVAFAVIGVLVLGAIALMSSSTKTTAPGTDTAAVSGIVSANENAQNAQVALATQYLDSFNSLENELISANAAVQEDAQNNATALSISNGDNTTAITETQLQAQATQNLAQIAALQSVQNTMTQQSANQAIANTNAGAQKTSAFWGAIGSIGSAIAGVFGEGK